MTSLAQASLRETRRIFGRARADDLLWMCTSYPAGSIARIGLELRQINERARRTDPDSTYENAMKEADEDIARAMANRIR